jgi:hypothetical protein
MSREINILKETNKFYEGLYLEHTGYLIIYAENSEYYIPNALHIQKNDDKNIFEDDYKAALQAKKDGIPLICNMRGIEDNVYIDTLENREIIEKALKDYPEYYIAKK